MERIERGWAGHYICGPDCQWHRNTLIKNDDGRMIVVSSVGALVKRDRFGNRKGFDYIGCNRWYETYCAIAKQDGIYYEVDVRKNISVPEHLEWGVFREPDGKTDAEAEKNHEDMVDYVMKNFDKCYAEGEERYKEFYA